MNFNRVNVGEIIRGVVESKHLSKAEFAKSVGIARQNIEKTVFQKRSLDTELLCRISEVLECNFFNYYLTENCSNNKYDVTKELRATLIIEMGAEKQDKTVRFVFGENNIELLNK